MCAASAVPGLPSPALGSAPGLAVLALQSSGEREIHPCVPEMGCEETAALLLLLSPGVNFPLRTPRVRPGLRFALDSHEPRGVTRCVSCHRCSGLSWYEFGGGILNQLVKLCSHSLPLRSLSVIGLLRETLLLVKKHLKKFARNFSVLLAVRWPVCPVVRVMLWQWDHGQCVCACCSSWWENAHHGPAGCLCVPKLDKSFQITLFC